MKYVALFLATIAILGCVTQGAPPDEVAPIPIEVQAFVAQMTADHGEPMIYDNYPVVILRWNVGASWVCVFLGYDEAIRDWVVAVYEVPVYMIGVGGV